MPLVLEALEAFQALGRDANGRMLLSEARAWLDEQEITSRCERAWRLRLMQAADNAYAELRAEEIEERRKGK